VSESDYPTSLSRWLEIFAVELCYTSGKSSSQTCDRSRRIATSLKSEFLLSYASTNIPKEA